MRMLSEESSMEFRKWGRSINNIELMFLNEWTSYVDRLMNFDLESLYIRLIDMLEKSMRITYLCKLFVGLRLSRKKMKNRCTITHSPYCDKLNLACFWGEAAQL